MFGYWKALSRSVKTHHEGKRDRHDTAYIHSYTVSVQSKWNQRGTSVRHFVCISACLNACVCERDYACRCIHVDTYVCTGSRQCPTGHMSRASKTEGGQLSSFVLSMGHHLIPVQSRGRDGASETTATNCSLSVRQMGGRGSYVGGVRGIHAGGLYISIPAV